MYSYLPDHPCANKAGKVLEHVYVMSRFVGRKLKSSECVHRKDRNRKNNTLPNLQLMTRSDHRILHAIEDGDYKTEDRTCLNCAKIFKTSARDCRKYCSKRCGFEASRRITISKEDLETLVWQTTIAEVAKILNVSDRAVSKKCDLLGISRPPQGYWLKANRVVKL